MNYLDRYRHALGTLPEGVYEAEVDAERRVSTLVKCSGGEIVETGSSDTTELFVRASGEKTGYAYTQDLEEEPDEVLTKALGNSSLVERAQRDRLNAAFVRKASTDDGIDDPDIPSMKKASSELDEVVRGADQYISSVTVEIRAEGFSRSVINSCGLDVEAFMNLYSATAMVMAEKNGLQYNTSCYTSAEDPDHLDLAGFKERISASLSHQYDATEIESGEHRVLLDSTVVTNILMTAWQLFSGIKYNDGSSALSGRLGEAIGSSFFSVVDSPSHELTGYRYEFDCEGSPCVKQVLVDKGRLAGLMHNISSATRLGVSSSGNAGRYALLSGSIPTDIIITPRIIYVEPGSKSMGELLEELGDGIYITHSYDVFHSINIGSGGFSIPCRGTVIRKGREDHNVTGMTMNGKLIDLFTRVLAVGGDLYIEEFLRKSYCVGAPSLLIEKLQINGK